ncbi:MAG: toll/interleukin-1 receptor domain-containing protein [Roseibium sp.]
MLPTTLQITICMGADHAHSERYAEALLGCFRAEAGGYLDGGGDLHVPVRVFSAIPSNPAPRHLDEALHNVMVVLVSTKLNENAAHVAWIDAVGGIIKAADPRHKMFVVDIDGTFPEFLNKAPKTGWAQMISVTDFGEDAIRPAKLGLAALSLAIRAVSSGSVMIPDRLQFFISHAKLDSQPLARVLSDLIDDLPQISGFYDAKDIPTGSNWQQVLQKGVRSSVLVVLRSELYETRHWCIQEAHWADEYATPILIVDIRAGLFAAPSKLSLENGPAVKVTDGNFYRILYACSCVALNARMHMRAVQYFFDQGALGAADTTVLVRRPSMLALHRACIDLANTSTGGEQFVIYPDPPMQDSELSAARSFASSISEDIRVETLQSLVVEGYFDP